VTDRRRMPGGAQLFLIGACVGFVIALVVVELVPMPEEPDLAHYREVRDFVREAAVREVTDDELLDLALHGMLSGIDVYSRYYDRDEAQALDRETVGRYVGIGVVFKRPIIEGQVLFPLAGSPAARAGLAVGDRILEIDDRPLAEMTSDELRATLSSLDAETLRVRVVSRSGEERRLRIQPESVVDPTVRHTGLVDRERKIGYIAILSFSRETPAEFDSAFRFLEERGMQGLVLDLRGNHGGVLVSAVRIARRFMAPKAEDRGGVIVSTEGRGEPIAYRADPEEAWYAGFPLVVLVDGESASASEVLAAALQEHRLAVVTGSPTYGKGMVQTIRRFVEQETVAKITSSYYYSPTHRNFERTVPPGREYGILPDLAVALLPLEADEIHAFLNRYSPPLEAIGHLEDWEREEGIQLIEAHPPDAQLQAALDLFAGIRPGPHRIQNE